MKAVTATMLKKDKMNIMDWRANLRTKWGDFGVHDHPKVLNRTTWAFGEAEQRVENWNAQRLANTTWAFARQFTAREPGTRQSSA